MNEKHATPLMRQYSEIKLQYQDAIVLFRMGDFYETFNEDAKKTASAFSSFPLFSMNLTTFLQQYR